MSANRIRVDDDEENDEYVLDVESVPDVDVHACVPSGVEDLVRKFKDTIQRSLTKDIFSFLKYPHMSPPRVRCIR